MGWDGAGRGMTLTGSRSAFFAGPAGRLRASNVSTQTVEKKTSSGEESKCALKRRFTKSGDEPRIARDQVHHDQQRESANPDGSISVFPGQGHRGPRSRMVRRVACEACWAAKVFSAKRGVPQEAEGRRRRIPCRRGPVGARCPMDAALGRPARGANAIAGKQSAKGKCSTASPARGTYWGLEGRLFRHRRRTCPYLL